MTLSKSSSHKLILLDYDHDKDEIHINFFTYLDIFH